MTKIHVSFSYSPFGNNEHIFIYATHYAVGVDISREPVKQKLIEGEGARESQADCSTIFLRYLGRMKMESKKKGNIHEDT